MTIGAMGGAGGEFQTVLLWLNAEDPISVKFEGWQSLLGKPESPESKHQPPRAFEDLW